MKKLIIFLGLFLSVSVYAQEEIIQDLKFFTKRNVPSILQDHFQWKKTEDGTEYFRLDPLAYLKLEAKISGWHVKIEYDDNSNWRVIYSSDGTNWECSRSHYIEKESLTIEVEVRYSSNPLNVCKSAIKKYFKEEEEFLFGCAVNLESNLFCMKGPFQNDIAFYFDLD